MRLIDVDWLLEKMDKTIAQPITPSEHYAWRFVKALLEKTPTFTLPVDYVYDCETSEFIVFKNKYNGKEIHVEKML